VGLGNLGIKLRRSVSSKEITLVVTGITSSQTTQEGGEMIAEYDVQPGVTPQPPPYMEVKDASGNWVHVPENRQIQFLM